MKKIISFTIAFCTFVTMFAFPAEAYIAASNYPKMSVVEEQMLDADNSYSFSTPDGKIDILKLETMTYVDLFTEFAKYHDPSELLPPLLDYMEDWNSQNSAKYNLGRIEVYYDYNKLGELEASYFPEISDYSWFNIYESLDGIGVCVFCWESTTAEELDECIGLLRERIGKDVIWIDLGFSTIYGTSPACNTSVVADFECLGDLNCDNTIDLKDVVLLTQYVSGWDVETNGNADFYYDGEVNMIDVVSLIRYTAGLS